MRIGEVAERLGVSVGTARNYFDAGEFKQDQTLRLRHGDRRVWSEEVDRYVKAMRQPPTPSGPNEPTA